jgi:hypothetical protein
MVSPIFTAASLFLCAHLLIALAAGRNLVSQGRPTIPWQKTGRARVGRLLSFCTVDELLRVFVFGDSGACTRTEHRQRQAEFYLVGGLVGLPRLTTSLPCLSFALTQFRFLGTIDLHITPLLNWRCRPKPYNQGTFVLERLDHVKCRAHSCWICGK